MHMLTRWMFLGILLTMLHTARSNTTTICNTTEACADGSMGASTLICQQSCPDNNCSIVQSCAQGIMQYAVVECSQCKEGMSCPASATITNGSSSPSFGARTGSSAQLVHQASDPSTQSLGIITKPILFDPPLPPANNRVLYSFIPSRGPLDGKEITLYIYNERDPSNQEQVVSLYAQIAGHKPVTVRHLSAVNRTVTKLSELYRGSKVFLSPEGQLLFYHAPRTPKFLNVEKAVAGTKKGTS